MEDFRRRVKQAFKNSKAAWDAMAGEGSEFMTPEQFKKWAADLGIPPGQAEKLFKEMDKDGDGLLSEHEFQNAMGIDEDELRERALEKFGNAEEILKQADLNGDGQLTEDELKEFMEEKLGISPEQAEKLAKDLMKKYDKDGDGKLSKEEAKPIFQATASDLQDRIQEQLGSAADAMAAWDKDGDGVLSEQEFMDGCKSMGISEEACRNIWKEKSGGDGKMTMEEFANAFGVGPDELLEACFAKFGNPQNAFDVGDKDEDGLISEDEWKTLGSELGFNENQMKRLWGLLDTNEGENTKDYISRWEWFDLMDYEEPRFVTFGDGFGDIDPFGTEHKKFNVMTHAQLHPPEPAKAAAGAQVTLHKVTANETSQKDHQSNKATNSEAPPLPTRVSVPRPLDRFGATETAPALPREDVAIPRALHASATRSIRAVKAPRKVPAVERLKHALQASESAAARAARTEAATASQAPAALHTKGSPHAVEAPIFSNASAPDSAVVKSAESAPMGAEESASPSAQASPKRGQKRHVEAPLLRMQKPRKLGRARPPQ